MDWWQIALIILAAIAAGLLVGGAVSYLITRFLNRSSVKEREPAAMAWEPLQTAKTSPIRRFFNKFFAKKTEFPEVVTQEVAAQEIVAQEVSAQETIAQEVAAEPQPSYPPEPPANKTPPKKGETSEKAIEEPTFTASGLLEEIEKNRRIASDALPSTGNLTPFETSMWDASRDGAHNLPSNFRDDVAQAYVDMRLANSIVWLSVELGRRSPNLDESYSKLCNNIANRLNRISPQLKQN